MHFEPPQHMPQASPQWPRVLNCACTHDRQQHADKAEPSLQWCLDYCLSGYQGKQYIMTMMACGCAATVYNTRVTVLLVHDIYSKRHMVHCVEQGEDLSSTGSCVWLPWGSRCEAQCCRCEAGCCTIIPEATESISMCILASV